MTEPHRPGSVCAVQACHAPVIARGWCFRHYQRWRRHGDVHQVARRPAVGLADYLWGRVDRSAGPDACWPWTGPRLPAGYGRLHHGGRALYAHRAAWEVAHGPIPPGLHVRHRCGDPPCCNPADLFLATASGAGALTR